MQRQQDRIMNEQVLGGVTYKAADYTMLPSDNLLLASSASGNITITLPRVAEARGQFYTIKKTQADNNVVVAQLTDAIDQLGGTADLSAGAVTLTALGDFLFLYSDGLHWHLLGETVT